MVGHLSPKQTTQVRILYPKQRFVTIGFVYTRGCGVLLDLPREIWDNGLMPKQWKQKVWFCAPDGTKGSNQLVATESNVTVGTIYNVFFYPEKVLPETAKMVLNTIAKLEYTVGKPTMKKCTKCKIVQPFKDFHINSRKGQLAPRCKKCNRIKHNEWAKKNRDKIKKRHSISWRKHKYGLTQEQYNDMILSQNNECAICKKPSHKTLHIDHDHTTGKVRGLLCSTCNTGIGFFNEDIDSLNNAVKYLKSSLDSPKI